MTMRPRISTILVLLACGGLLLWRHSPWRRLQDRDTANETVFQLLSQPIDFSVERRPLKVALEQFSRQTGIQVQMDSFLQPPPDPTKLSVSLHLSGVSGASVLDLLLRQVDLDWLPVVKDGRVTIASSDRALDSTAYFVGQLHTIPAAAVGSAGTDAVSLADAVKTLLSNTWEDVGGTGVAEPLPGAIAVSHLASTQRTIRRLVEAIAALEHDADSAPWVSITHPSTKAMLELQQKLEKKVSVDFDEIPLREALDELAREYSLPIFVDQLALNDVAIDLTGPVDTSGEHLVTLRLSDVAFSAVLTHLLHPFGVTHRICDQVIFITTFDQAEERDLDCRVYDVGVFLHEHQIDADTLIESITSLITPSYWADVGGVGYAMVCGRGLVVSASPRVHDQIVDFLRRLHTMLDPQAWPDNEEPETEHARLMEKLTQAVSLTVDQKPLAVWLDDLRAQYGLNLVVNPDVDPQVDLEAMVSGEVRDRPLLGAMKSLVRPLELDVFIVGEVLLLRPIEVSADDDALDIQMYNVAAIFPDSVTDPDAADKYANRLRSMVDYAVSPGTWDDVGGSGSMTTVQHVLIVRQTSEVQAELRALLQQLATVPDQPASTTVLDVVNPLEGYPDNAVQVLDGAPQVHRTRIYRVRRSPLPMSGDEEVSDDFWDLASLVDLLDEQLRLLTKPASETDEALASYVVGREPVVIARHSDAVHAEIESTLSALIRLANQAQTGPMTDFTAPVEVVVDSSPVTGRRIVMFDTQPLVTQLQAVAANMARTNTPAWLRDAANVASHSQSHGISSRIGRAGCMRCWTNLASNRRRSPTRVSFSPN